MSLIGAGSVSAPIPRPVFTWDSTIFGLLVRTRKLRDSYLSGNR